MMDSSTRTVSVVVPTYRRPEYLSRCLQALLTQKYDPAAYEIIIVDDCPEDPATRQLVLKQQERMQATQRSTPKLHYLPAHHKHGPAAARNQGWRAGLGEIIAFTDDDCLPDPNWLACGVAAFQDGVAGISGRVVVPLPPVPTDNELNTTGLERSIFVTANCFYRRSALLETGGFDERFGAAWREDSDLYFTLRERGYRLGQAEDAVVVHPVRPERWGCSVRQQRKSFYNALLYKKHPSLYRETIQPAPPWRYYGMLTGLLFTLAGTLLRRPGLAMGGLAAWLGLFILFCLQRLSRTSHAPGHIAEMVVTSLAIPYLSIYWRLRGALYWKVFFL